MTLQCGQPAIDLAGLPGYPRSTGLGAMHFEDEVLGNFHQALAEQPPLHGFETLLQLRRQQGGLRIALLQPIDDIGRVVDVFSSLRDENGQLLQRTELRRARALAPRQVVVHFVRQTLFNKNDGHFSAERTGPCIDERECHRT